MRILPVFRGALLCFYVSLVFAAAFCYADDSTAEVVGIGECADCAQSNIKTVHAFSGLKVTIDCKPENGEFKTRGVGELDEEGKFKVSLQNDVVKDGKLKEECYAQLHSASAAPCPAHNGLESSKIVFKSKTDEKHTFGLAGKLKFSPVTCTSAFLWPHPPITKPLPLPTWKLPPSKNFHHPYLFPPKVFPPLPQKIFPPLPPKVFPPIHKNQSSSHLQCQFTSQNQNHQSSSHLQCQFTSQNQNHQSSSLYHLLFPSTSLYHLPFQFISHCLQSQRSLHFIRSHALFLSFLLTPRFLQSTSTTPNSENGLPCHHILPFIRLFCSILTRCKYD
uniref:Proline-rich protein 4 n=1 Tax=Populus trichocarpa TaxID=3694 RepID=A0A2K1Z762_POPTR